MRFHLPVLASLLITAGLAGQAAAAGDDAAKASFAQRAVIRSLDFQQGDLGSLWDARYGFTEKGWGEFLGVLKGHLDLKGAPDYTSSFSLQDKPVISTQDDGKVHVTLSGKIQQTHGHSSTSSFVTIDVVVDGKPAVIEHFEQKNCGDKPCK